MYNPQKNKYSLPNLVYMQVIYIFKSYDYHLLEADRILHEIGCSENAGIPTKGGLPSNIVASKAKRREKHLKRIRLIDQVIEAIPEEEFREPVKRKLIYNIPYPENINQRKAKEYRRKVMWLLAYRLYLVG